MPRIFLFGPSVCSVDDTFFFTFFVIWNYLTLSTKKLSRSSRKHGKTCRNMFFLGKLRVGKVFENDIQYAFGLHSKEGEYCCDSARNKINFFCNRALIFRTEEKTKPCLLSDHLSCHALHFIWSWLAKQLSNLTNHWPSKRRWKKAHFQKHETNAQTRPHSEKKKWKIRTRRQTVDNFSR